MSIEDLFFEGGGRERERERRKKKRVSFERDCQKRRGIKGQIRARQKVERYFSALGGRQRALGGRQRALGGRACREINGAKRRGDMLRGHSNLPGGPCPCAVLSSPFAALQQPTTTKDEHRVTNTPRFGKRTTIVYKSLFLFMSREQLLNGIQTAFNPPKKPK